MKKIILFPLFFLLLVVVVNAKSLTVSPSVMDIEYYLDDAQPTSVVVTIENNDEDNFSLSIWKDGTSSNFFNISETSFFINGTETKTFNVNFNIPSTTSVNLYSGKINYGDSGEYIPVYINVKRRESLTECRLIMYDEYRYSIRKTTKPYTEEFTFKISSNCIDGVSIMSIKEDKVYRMESGNQPIRLTGAIPTGEYDGGDTVSFDVEYDVSELSRETYSSNIIITALNKANDASITKSLKFLITVTGENPSQYGGNVTTVATFPTCSIPTHNLVTNNTYELLCTNVVDPNIIVKTQPDLNYLRGISVVDDDDNKQFKWTFQPIKTGETTLKTYFELKGNQIGPTQDFDFKITASPVYSGTSMKFVFFGPSGKIDDCSSLKGGDNLVVQMRDNETDNIISDYVIYRDGTKLDGTSFDVEQGRTYSLSGTSPNYHSIDYSCPIKSKQITISLIPPDVEINMPVTISTNPANATLYWDDSSITSPYTPSVFGTHKLKAVKSGYQDYEMDVDVLQKFAFVTEIPDKIKKEKEVSIEMNRVVPWTVYYGKTNDTIDTVFVNQESLVVRFTPDQKGYYKLSVKGNNYVWKTGFSWGKFWMWLLIGIACVVVFLIVKKYMEERKREGGGGMMEMNVGDGK